jgi:hypothetical protein
VQTKHAFREFLQLFDNISAVMGVVLHSEICSSKYVLKDGESNGNLCLTLRLVWDVPVSL